MKKKNPAWSPLANQQLKELRKRIADAGAPKAAKSFIARLKQHANILRDFPEIGVTVEAFGIETIREIYFQDYRIIYDYDAVRVLILTIVHGSRNFLPHHLFGD
jgi:plasmid stabilization system protein ParE